MRVKTLASSFFCVFFWWIQDDVCVVCRHIKEIVQEQVQVREDSPLLNPVKAFKIGCKISVLGFCGSGPCLHRSDVPVILNGEIMLG